jgi:hypothetical protein
VHAYANGSCECNANCDSYGDSLIHSYGYRATEPYPNRHGYGYSYVDDNTQRHADSDCHVYSQTHAHCTA